MGQPLPNGDEVINDAMKVWFTNTGAEWSGISGQDFKCKETKFRIEPAVAKFASPWTGETAISVFRSSLASRALDTANVLARKAWQRTEKIHLVTP